MLWLQQQKRQNAEDIRSTKDFTELGSSRLEVIPTFKLSEIMRNSDIIKIHEEIQTNAQISSVCNTYKSRTFADTLVLLTYFQ